MTEDIEEEDTRAGGKWTTGDIGVTGARGLVNNTGHFRRGDTGRAVND